MAQITLEELGFRYPEATEDTLRGLSLDIGNGEAHALLGASGAGKTTLLNLLSGLLTPTAGRLLFDGKDVSQLAGRARNVAQVFQFPVLYESRTVAGNLAFPLENRGVGARDVSDRVARVCDALGISELRDRRPGSLSQFEKQLVAVGKALVRKDVSLVLLDEPLTAVEPKIKWRLRQTLREVQDDLGVTMIYVTHDQTEALTFADRVSVLAEGRILQTGSASDIYESPDHEFVGHFVGSPGMNFVPDAALGLSIGGRAGFRPEWAIIEDGAPLRGVITHCRIRGTRDGRPWGIVNIATDYGEISIRGNADCIPGDETGVKVLRYVAFTDGRKVDEGELV